MGNPSQWQPNETSAYFLCILIAVKVNAIHSDASDNRDHTEENSHSELSLLSSESQLYYKRVNNGNTAVNTLN